MKKPLVVLTGPTAAGKTSLSLRIARKIGGEIISADSMQVYRKMNIGTAKLPADRMEGIPHHLLDILEPDQEFNVTLFTKLAKEAAGQIDQRGHIPIVTGGTGFYIQAFLYGTDFAGHDETETYRKELGRIAGEKGEEALHAMLEEVDPDYAANVHAHNVRRVIRALEYYHETGEQLSAHNKKMREKEAVYNAALFVLYHEREVLYDRINRRVDQMMEEGLLEEVEGLVRAGYGPGLQSMQGLGYKEFFPYFEGKCSLEEAVERIKTDTRRFAKRQLTWFRSRKDVIWLCKDGKSEDLLLETILKELGDRKIIK